jgi:putative acetyltransferase
MSIPPWVKVVPDHVGARRGGGSDQQRLDPIVQYRLLTQADVPAISLIHRRACLIAYSFMNWRYSESEVRTWYAGKFREWSWGLLAAKSGVGVGFIAVSGAHLDQLFVDPNHQGRGIGTHLLKEALARTPAIKTLHVFEQNTRAREFYELYGFGEVQRFLNEQEHSVELVYGRALRSSGES